MDPSESDSTAVSNSIKDPELGTQSAPLPSSHHDPETSDLSHGDETDALQEDLQNKLDLKDKDEGGEEEKENKDSDFDDGKKVCGMAGTRESEKEEMFNEDNWNWNGKEKKDLEFDDGNIAGAGESEKVEMFNEDNWNWNGKEKKDSEFDDGNIAGAGESEKEEVFDEDNWNWNGNEDNSWRENVNESENDKFGIDDVTVGDEVEKNDEESSSRAYQYPVRPEAEDCSFYLKTGTCKFGSNCKFNHPLRRKIQYYLKSGGCKFGKACKFNHTRGKYFALATNASELNFLGLPIRLGEKECPYYMRTGSCKFGANCKFNHPDPTAVGGSDLPSGYGNGGAISLQGVSKPSVPPSWSSPRTLNETAPFVPMMLPPVQGVSPQSSDWNGYQAPVYLSERSMHPPPTYVVNNPAIETNVFMHNQKQMHVEEFPERPGEPECSYFLKTGHCKFKSNCKFHHPKNRIARPVCTLSERGLPLRPDQSVCSHYSRYGICKYGPSCKFDHPISLVPSTMAAGLDQESSYTNSASMEVAEMAGSGGASDSTIKQPV